MASDFSTLFAIGVKLGQGSFGNVHKVTCKQDRKEYALKVVELSSKFVTFAMIEKEVNVMRALDHPNILKLVKAMKSSTTEGELLRVGILLEFCSDGDLMVYIRRRFGNPIDSERLLTWMKQLGSAVAYIHGKNIMHRDMKPANVFIAKNDLKLGDFGIAKQMIFTYAGTAIGTPAFMAPETFHGLYGLEADIYSLGCVFLCMATLKQMPKTMKGELQPLPPELKYGKHVNLLIRDCVQNDKTVRPTAQEVCERLCTRQPDPKPVWSKVKQDKPVLVPVVMAAKSPSKSPENYKDIPNFQKQFQKAIPDGPKFPNRNLGNSPARDHQVPVKDAVKHPVKVFNFQPEKPGIRPAPRPIQQPKSPLKNFQLPVGAKPVFSPAPNFQKQIPDSPLDKALKQPSSPMNNDPSFGNKPIFKPAIPVIQKKYEPLAGQAPKVFNSPEVQARDKWLNENHVAEDKVPIKEQNRVALENNLVLRQREEVVPEKKVIIGVRLRLPSRSSLDDRLNLQEPREAPVIPAEMVKPSAVNDLPKNDIKRNYLPFNEVFPPKKDEVLNLNPLNVKEESKSDQKYISAVRLEIPNLADRRLNKELGKEMKKLSISEDIAVLPKSKGLLSFHEVHGKSISLFKNKRKAERKGHSNLDGILFSSRPIQVEEKVKFKIKETCGDVDNYLVFGFTSVDPHNVADSVPYSIHSLAKIGPTWKVVLRPDARTDKDFSFHVESSGAIVTKTGNEKETRHGMEKVDTSKNFWAVIDIQFKIKCIKLKS